MICKVTRHLAIFESIIRVLGNQKSFNETEISKPVSYSGDSDLLIRSKDCTYLWSQYSGARQLSKQDLNILWDLDIVILYNEGATMHLYGITYLIKFYMNQRLLQSITNCSQLFCTYVSEQQPSAQWIVLYVHLYYTVPTLSAII